MMMCKQADKKLGQVGVVDNVDPTLFQTLLSGDPSTGESCIPVISPVGFSKDGSAFNINADWAAIHMTIALKIKKVLFLTDQEGICDSEMKLIPELDAGELENLIETGVVKGGMLAKVRTMLHGLKHGVKDVHVLNARRPHGLIEELFTDRGVGTVCRVRSRGRT